MLTCFFCNVFFFRLWVERANVSGGAPCRLVGAEKVDLDSDSLRWALFDPGRPRRKTPNLGKDTISNLPIGHSAWSNQ